MPNIRPLLVLPLIAALFAVPVDVVPVDAGQSAAKASPTKPATDIDLEILRDTIRANKKALVAANLNLTDAEKQKFWAVYDSYQKELTAIQDRYLRVIQDYTASFETLTDEHALKLIDDYLGAEDDRAKLRRAYVAQFSAVVPGLKVARFYQIENKMDAVLRYDLAATIPVVKE
jgi:hypothetical protein